MIKWHKIRIKEMNHKSLNDTLHSTSIRLLRHVRKIVEREG